MAELEDSLRPIVSRLRKVWERLKRVPDFDWARVTSVSPLKIRFELAGQDFAGTPSTLVADLKTDDRVLCLVKRNRVTIVGRSRNDTVRRFANTTALNGWSPVDGSIAYVTSDNRHYVRRDGSWHSVIGVEEHSLTLEPGFTDGGIPARLVCEGTLVTVSVHAAGTFAAGTYHKVAQLPPGFAPEYVERVGAMGSAMRGYCGMQVDASGQVHLGWAGAGLSAPSWIQGTITYRIS